MATKQQSLWRTIGVLLFSASALGVAPRPAVVLVLLMSVPLWALYSVSSRMRYWVMTGLMGALFTGVFGVTHGILFLSVVLLVGVFREFFDRGTSLLSSGVISVMLSFGVSILFLGFWVKTVKHDFMSELKSGLIQISDEMVKANAKLVLDPEILFQQIPSAYFAMLVLALSIAVKAGPKLQMMLEGHPEIVSQEKRELSIPSVFIWATLASILGSVLLSAGSLGQVVFANLLNVFVVLYFLQGISVIASLFSTYKVGALWQTFWYFLLVVQFGLIVSLVGFSDYWINYRQRFVKREAKSKLQGL